MTLRVDLPESGRAMIHLNGAFDRKTVPDYRKRLLEIVRNRQVVELTVDLSAVEQVDTAGIAVLVEVMQALSGRDGRLRLIGLSEKAKQVVRLARLEEVLGVA